MPILLCCLLCACGYGNIVHFTPNGKKIKERAYRNPEKEEAYRTRMFFKYRYKESNYSKYTGRITQEQTQNGRLCVQFDSSRIYLLKDIAQYAPLFTCGVLYPHQFYCAMDTSCKFIQPYTIIERNSGKDSVKTIADEALTISSFEEPRYLKVSPQCRRFKIAIPYGAGGSIILVELKNNTVQRYVSIDEFAKNAHLSFISVAWNWI